jgi:hypothetical protein
MSHGINYEIRTRIYKITYHIAWYELMKFEWKQVKSHTMRYGINSCIWNENK